MTKWFLCGLALLAALWNAAAADGGGSVVVVYNKNLPESKTLAEYYASKRAVPKDQLFGVDVSASADAMSRPEFQDKLQEPLYDWLLKQKLFTRNPKERAGKDTPYQPIVDSKVRYIVLCYGIPWKIARDNNLKEEGTEKIQEPLRGRNEAAVDADLALLPASREKNLPLTGPLISPFYLTTNAAAFHPTNGIIMVTRLDGPSIEIARGLVDKALEAEANGLWGNAYFDARGLTNGEYKVGDDWIRTSAEITYRTGFETRLDDRDATFATGFPMSQIAFYAGWYDTHVSGPFTRSTVEFMPGAFAYHLHSYSAAMLRSTNQNWVGPLLAKGATITMGSVDEPYLTGTPNIAAFLDRLIVRAWTFGEAAYAAQGAISWQTTVVGDPLYRPFGEPPPLLHFKLEREKNPLVEWSHLRVVDLNMAKGTSAKEAIDYINSITSVRTNSAVLQEKLGQLIQSDKRLTSACEAYGKALKLKPSPQQKIRLLLTIGELQTLLGREQEAFDAYQQLVTDAPDFPDAGRIYRELAGLARKLKKTDEAEKFEKKAEQLRPIK
ncbi:MAG TPA: TIGR03790 family protein [Candidatus Limnocylindria bacterium]|nr:TIGR03790 family protein [Candidatus Limnocylindria bacterium]